MVAFGEQKHEAQKPIPKRRFEPIGDMVALHITKQADTTHGGVVIPETSKNEWTTIEALVIATGPECKQVVEGEKVLVSPSTRAVKVRFQGDEYYLIGETQLVGVVLPDGEEEERNQEGKGSREKKES